MRTELVGLRSLGEDSFLLQPAVAEELMGLHKIEVQVGQEHESLLVEQSLQLRNAEDRRTLLVGKERPTSLYAALLCVVPWPYARHHVVRARQ